MNRRALAVLILLVAAPLAAQERIVDYDAVVQIRSDAALIVTETIEVVSEGDAIRRGIYRDFPTMYRDALGNRVRVPFEVLGITRDGTREPWHTEEVAGGTRVYIGAANVLLEPGTHTYEIRYRTDRQLGFFEEYDELYWNVTGNDWAFPIRRVRAEVRLPEPVPADRLSLAAYVGERGDVGRDWTVEVPSPGVAVFTTDRVLRPQEGLTIAVGFPKGIVEAPTALERGAAFAHANRGAIVGLIGLLATLCWYGWAWNRVGRDPAPGAIYPRYEAPEGYSPGMLRYVWRMGHDRTATAAAIVSMAVAGALKLDKHDDDWAVVRADREPSASTEAALHEALFADGEELVFESSEHARVGKALKRHERSLNARLERDYFRLNRTWWVPGLLVSLASALALVLLSPGESPGIGPFLAVFALIWNGVTLVMIGALMRSWRDRAGLAARLSTLLGALFMLPFPLVGLGLIGMFGWQVGVLPALILVLHVVVTVLFYQLMKAPTLRGRRLLDAIEGLRLYLDIAERDDLERLHGGRRPVTIEEFERLLPYAVALDCADTWARRFESAIQRAERDGTLQGRPWYSPSMRTGDAFSARNIGSALASGLAGGISGAASPPGSSSGSGGGGFSGGGGGGGGGGGW